MDAISKARALRRDSTDAERLLWYRLRGRRLVGAKFKRQEPVGPYFADFICHEAMLVVELDGGQHAERLGYDERRTEFLEGQGFRVMRFWNNDVMQNLEGVLETIASTLTRDPHPDPLPLRGRGSKK